MKSTGVTDATIGFILYYDGGIGFQGEGTVASGYFKDQIQAMKSDITISFGGSEGVMPAAGITDTTELTAAYELVLTTYGVNRLDFDIEGDNLSNEASLTRRCQALVALKKKYPSVYISFTLGVMPDGFPSGSGSQLYVLQNAKTNGFVPDEVRIMAMDYGSSYPAVDGKMATYAIKPPRRRTSNYRH